MSVNMALDIGSVEVRVAGGLGPVELMPMRGVLHHGRPLRSAPAWPGLPHEYGRHHGVGEFLDL
jgi:hypothetical protein